MVSTYTSGQVDAALSTVAFFVPIVSEVRPSTGILFSDVGLHLPGYGLVVHKDMITEHPDILAKVVAVNKRAWDYIFAGHEEEAVDAIMKERANVRPDRKVLLGQLKMYMPLFDTPATKGKPRGWQADEDWRSALAAMEKAGVVKAGWQTSTYYTNKFIPQ
jgi:NitT/TauT family transport system substrate-binding protein